MLRQLTHPRSKICECCGSTKKLTKDHKIPKSKGGTNHPDNIGTLCVYCNSIKGDKIMDYAQLRTFIELLVRQKKERKKIIVVPWKESAFIPRPMTEKQRAHLKELVSDEYH